MAEFRLPDPGEGIHEAEILEVSIAEGDSVDEGQTVLTVETDKASVEVPAPFTGVVDSIRVEPGDVVDVGDVVMTWHAEGEEPTGEEPREDAEALETTEADEQVEETAPPADTRGRPAKKRAKGRPAKTRAAARTAEPEEPAPARRDGAPIPASPATRRLARELAVDLAKVDGSGPGGRVTADDVEAAAEPQRKTEPEAEDEARDRRAAQRDEGRPFTPETPPFPDLTTWGPVHREPLRSIRRATAERMAVAWSRIPHVTHQDVADITELERFRREHRDAADEEDATLSLTALVLKVAVAALKEHPRFNASLDAEAGEIVFRDYYHIGIAVATERGLLVPVLRDADRKNLVEIAVELAALADRARQGDLRLEDMRGGTFTITNPGPLGGTAFTPIINWPQVAILGMAKARWEPVAEGERERPRMTQRLMLPLCLAFDHRVNDGADAARFTSTIVEMLSDPASLTLSA